MQEIEDHPAGFLAAPPVDEHMQRMYDGDLGLQGYVANLTRVWAYSPEALAALSYVLRRASDTAGLDVRRRALLVTTCASTIQDSYCSLAFGSKLAAADGPAVVARLLSGHDDAVSVDDAQVFAITLFVALRMAFSTVNDALGAAPDAELASRAHPDVRTAVT